MNRFRFVISAVSFLFYTSVALAQKPGAPIDIIHYRFLVEINDGNDSIRGDAEITFRALKESGLIKLDLVSVDGSGKGMQTLDIREGDRPLDFSHHQDELEIHFNPAIRDGEIKKIRIRYTGIPADGLVISTNKYHHRTFFGDNWPNRAHHWLPCVDHPADKASVEFIILAPEHYQVVSNGLKTEEINLPGHIKQTHYEETAALATKVMVFGAADFAVNYPGETDCIPVYSWIYPEDREKGFYDYAQALEILPFFISHIGPYAYRKLADVQSKTMFGGMENAGAIFYSENSVTGDRKSEALLTHEIAHQWFGNSATEKDWRHLWLSEGFATYMTHLYLEQKYGRDTLVRRIKDDRETIIAFSKKRNTPVVDTAVKNGFMQLLNPNSYQKGGWVLHMLRHRLGDSVFWKGIRNYYFQFAGHNADTEDFRKAMEETSGVDLQSFFQQWLYTPGQPVLRTASKYDRKTRQWVISIEQLQDHLFEFPLEISIESGSQINRESLLIRERKTLLPTGYKTNLTKIILDPDSNLLFEENTKESN